MQKENRHPEQKRNEIFLCNVVKDTYAPNDFSEYYFEDLDYRSKRSGINAYDPRGKLLENKSPVFISLKEWQKTRNYSLKNPRFKVNFVYVVILLIVTFAAYLHTLSLPNRELSPWMGLSIFMTFIGVVVFIGDKDERTNKYKSIWERLKIHNILLVPNPTYHTFRLYFSKRDNGRIFFVDKKYNNGAIRMIFYDDWGNDNSRLYLYFNEKAWQSVKEKTAYRIHCDSLVYFNQEFTLEEVTQDEIRKMFLKVA